MGASNRIQDLDPALLRPGRFDRQLLVAPPDLAGREQILDVHTRGKPLADGVDLQSIARQTAGLAGADLANICNEAAIFAGRRNLDRIGQAEFEAAMERVVAGLQQRRVVSEKEKRILAYHEAGHALMSYLMGEALPVQKVTIVSRGQCARLHAQPADRGPVPAHEGRARRHDEGLPRRPGRRAGRLRPRHERRRQRPREGDRPRPRDGLRVRHGRGRLQPDDARRQLRAVRGDEAAPRRRAGASHRRGVPGGDPPARRSTAPTSTASPRRCSRRRR